MGLSFPAHLVVFMFLLMCCFIVFLLHDPFFIVPFLFAAGSCIMGVGLYSHACDLVPYFRSCTYKFAHHEDMVSFLLFLSCTNQFVHREDIAIFPSQIFVHHEGWPYTRMSVACLFIFCRAQIGHGSSHFSSSHKMSCVMRVGRILACVWFLFCFVFCRAQINYSAS